MMTLSDMRIEVARNINYLTDSNTIPADADINAADIDAFLNRRYRQEIYPALSEKRPEFFFRDATYRSWNVTGTVSASSTGTTLVASSSIFSNDMVDAYVYNSTDDESAYITAFTDATTVTLDSTIDDDWDGDTIYVFTGTYSLLGDANDQSSVRYVGIKYDSGDNDFTRVSISEDREMYKYFRGRDQNQRFSENSPVYRFLTVTQSELPTSAIQIRPIPTEVMDSAVFVTYLEQPSEMVNNSDVPRLPLGHEMTLVYGATADAFRKMQKFQEASVYDSPGIEAWLGTGLYNKAFRRILRWHQAERTNKSVDFMRGTHYGWRRQVN